MSFNLEYSLQNIFQTLNENRRDELVDIIKSIYKIPDGYSYIIDRYLTSTINYIENIHIKRYNFDYKGFENDDETKKFIFNQQITEIINK